MPTLWEFRDLEFTININDPQNPIAAGGYSSSGYSHDAMVVTYNGPDEDYKGRNLFRMQ